MKELFRTYGLILMLLVSAASVWAANDCTGYNPDKHPDHYCDCKGSTQLSMLPFDVQVNDSIWFKGSSNLFLKGFTAYLYSDCDVNFDIYQSCVAKAPLYSVTIPKNQARDVSAETIKQKLEESGMSASSMAIYICIYPLDGKGGRLMCYPYNTGHHSTCTDMLHLLPGMTFVSSHTDDVYEIKAADIPTSLAMYLQWTEDNNAPAHLRLTRGGCDATTIAEYDFLYSGDCYRFDPALLAELSNTGESLYAHFTHDASAIGRIRMHEAATTNIIADTTICQGKQLQLDSISFATDTLYTYDRQWNGNVLDVYSYQISFTAPAEQYDTLYVRSSDLPLLYRDQYTIPADGYGDYDITIHHNGQCDERYLLHVEHLKTTIHTTIDTILCQGRIFTHNGKPYKEDVSFVDSTWINIDTLSIYTLNVHFSAPEIQYDTIYCKTNAFPFRYRSKLTINNFGDYELLIQYSNACNELYHLHVGHAITYRTSTLDTTVCQGQVFEYKGIQCISDTLLLDTVDINADTREVISVYVSFTAPEVVYDTLHLYSTDLPLLYRDQYTIPADGYGDYDITIHHAGQCDERYLLHVAHKVDVRMSTIDTTLCQGRVFEYKGIQCISDTAWIDTVDVNVDTREIISIHVSFAAPEVQYDTLHVYSTDLPLLYRDQYTIPVDGYGDYDITIHHDNECDERYLLHVAHQVDIYMNTIDTTLCQGRIFEYEGIEYTTDTTFWDTAWVNVDLRKSVEVTISFTAPEMEYDSVVVPTADLQAGYYYALADTYIYTEGTYFYELLKHNECTRHITLTVIEDVTSGLANPQVSHAARLVIINGMIFVQNGQDIYTILGEKITDNVIIKY